MAPTHYRDKTGACVACGDTTFSWAAFITFCIISAVTVSTVAKYGCGPCVGAAGCCFACLCAPLVRCCRSRRCRCCSCKLCRCRAPATPSQDGKKRKSFADNMRVKAKIVIGFCLYSQSAPYRLQPYSTTALFPSHATAKLMGLPLPLRTDQILLAITSTFDYQWPTLTLQFMVWMRVFTLDLPVRLMHHCPVNPHPAYYQFMSLRM